MKSAILQNRVIILITKTKLLLNFKKSLKSKVDIDNY